MHTSVCLTVAAAQMEDTGIEGSPWRSVQERLVAFSKITRSVPQTWEANAPKKGLSIFGFFGSRKLFLKACWGPFTKPCPGPDQEHVHGFQGLKHKETSYKICGSTLGPVSDFVAQILK